MSHSSVFVVTFLGAAVEVIEMVIIIVGLGSVRGCRSTWLGATAGLAVLAVLVAIFGTALRAVPIDVLRVVIGTLLLTFGLPWLRKGIRPVSANGLRGMGPATVVTSGGHLPNADQIRLVLFPALAGTS